MSPARHEEGRRRATFALYDVPLRRDWLWWLTGFWVALPLVILISAAAAGKSTPWVGGIGAAILLALALGVVPALVRLWIRKSTASRRLRRGWHPPMKWADIQESRNLPDALATGRNAAVESHAATSTSHTNNPGFESSSATPDTTAGTGAASATHAADGVGAVPVVVVDAPSAALLREAYTNLPYPAASALHRLHRAQNAKEHYEAVIESAETLAVTATVTLAALLRARGRMSARSSGPTAEAGQDLLRLRNALTGRPMMFGAWTAWLGALAARTERYPGIASLLNGVLHDKQSRPGLVTCLNALREERNRAAHGNNIPRSMPEYAQRAQETGVLLGAAIRSAEFLRDFPWLLTESVVYQPRSAYFDVTAQVAMGSHPDFDLNKSRFSVPVGTGTYYLLDSGRPVALAPLVASRYCSLCMAMEMCFVTHVDPLTGPATLRSFSRGHDIYDVPLADEVRDLAAT